MCCKGFENRFANKKLMSKNVFEQGFCIGKGDNPKIFNFWILANLASLFKRLDPFSYNLVLVL